MTKFQTQQRMGGKGTETSATRKSKCFGSNGRREQKVSW